jgi:electron transfer flavoprotein alpha subunit
MHMKRAVRGFMTGQLQVLKDLLDIHWSEYTVTSARKDMRHCRDTCAVYTHLGEEADLTQLESGQREYKGHRRVFDGATNLITAAVAPESLTEKQMKAVNALKKLRAQKIEKAAAMKEAEENFQSLKRRRDHQEKRNKDPDVIDKRKFNGGARTKKQTINDNR